MFGGNPKVKTPSQRCVIGNNTIDHGKSLCHQAGKEGREEEKQHRLLGENVAFSNISGAQSVTLLPSGMCFPAAPARRGQNQSGLIVRLIFTVSFNRYRTHMCVCVCVVCVDSKCVCVCVSSIWISCQGGRQKHRHPSGRRNYIFFFSCMHTRLIWMSPLCSKNVTLKKKKERNSKNVSSVLRLLLDLPLINKCILVPSHISLQPNTALQIAS